MVLFVHVLKCVYCWIWWSVKNETLPLVCHYKAFWFECIWLPLRFVSCCCVFLNCVSLFSLSLVAFFYRFSFILYKFCCVCTCVIGTEVDLAFGNMHLNNILVLVHVKQLLVYLQIQYNKKKIEKKDDDDDDGEEEEEQKYQKGGWNKNKWTARNWWQICTIDIITFNCVFVYLV